MEPSKKSTAEYAFEVLGADKIADPKLKEFFRQHYAARYEPQDHTRQLAFIEYMTKAWPWAVKEYLQRHGLQDVESITNEAGAVGFLFDTANGMADVVEDALKQLAVLARKTQSKKGAAA
jgi:hypothetical protein